MAAPHISSDPAALKAAQRRQALALRAPLDPQAAGALMAGHVLRDAPPPAGAVVAGYWPLGSEIDPRPLLHALAARGHAIVLPVTPARGLPLTFRRWQPGDAMAAGRFGTACPTGAAMAPNWLLVPLLAFDPCGNRLGYGAGYYDRTLAGLPHAVALGCAFAAQQVARVAAGPLDVRLRAVATEAGIIAARPPSAAHFPLDEGG
jgi:5-formyltetrahydrofolate cyclo-ligase